MTDKASPSIGPSDIRHLKEEVDYRTRLQSVCHKIYGARNLDALFLDLEGDIADLLKAERFTVYGIDGITRELVSRFKSGDEIKDIRLPVSAESVAGFAALRQQMVNIPNVRDRGALAGIDPALKFDPRWDQRTGFETRQVLAAPIRCEKYLMGALQVINSRRPAGFSSDDESAIGEIANMFGIAFYNQKKLSRKRPKRFDFLLENHLITESQLAQAIALSRNGDVAVEKILMEHFGVQKADVGRALSYFFKVPFVGNDPLPLPSKAMIKGVKPAFMTRNVWAPWRMENGRIDIAIDDPSDLPRIDGIRGLFPGMAVRICVGLKPDILKMCQRLSDISRSADAFDDIIRRMQEEDAREAAPAVEVQDQDNAVIQLVNKAILDAFEMGASDIHVEPFQGRREAEIRLRVDGRCREYGKIPAAFKHAVVSRIKIMADLDIAERRRPQDGKIDFRKFGGKPVELRVATIPTQGGVEDVVMRIVSSGKPVPLKKLNFSRRNYDKFLEAVEMPYGLIFVCGPTGSGKTTTLHAALQHLNRTERKIWTAEDPVEITQSGLRQVQVKPKIEFGFAQALRAFLRADPDVIMVGEMRDRETARIGIEASLTGHLVLSTLHTNSAPESVIRLLDMGMDPFHFADAVRCVLAQRLVPTLCGKCKEAYRPTRVEIEELVREYGHGDYEPAGVDFDTAEGRLFRPRGCSHCGGTGYRGRMGIHELLVGSAEIKRMIQTRQPVDAIRRQAASEGMTSLKQDGIEKVFAGHCDLFQVRKVCIQ
jgi:type II secretory ATPase GspE/PulE/Tfp pilus assembly ATPase PilB-like protein